MSSAVGAVSTSKSMGFDEDKDHGKEDKVNETGTKPGGDDETGGRIPRQMSESSLYATEDEDESDVEGKIQLGPQFTLKEQLEKDKDDESLRKWKEQLLGSVDVNSIGETLEPDVKILSLAIKSPDRPDIFLPIPESGKPKGLWFSLKEGSRYSLKFTFQVCNNIVSGLKYTNTVWKTGVKVDSTKEMLGTFSPQVEPYMHEMPEETTPSGFFARGTYSAKTKGTSLCHGYGKKENSQVEAEAICVSVFNVVAFSVENVIWCGLLMMITSATWRSITLLISGRTGRKAELCPVTHFVSLYNCVSNCAREFM